MADSKRYENLEHALCKELEKLDRKYTADAEMTDQDAERARVLFHALKSAETLYAMKDAQSEDGEEGRSYRDGMSGARYRSPRTGRYISRAYPEDGYAGRYPMDYIDPYLDRRM